MGGIDLDWLAKELNRRANEVVDKLDKALPSTFLLKEDNKGQRGELHAMTAKQAKQIHRALHAEHPAASYTAYRALAARREPVQLRDLLEIRETPEPLEVGEVESKESVLSKFCSGAMSFGAINAESQRDIILAMRTVGGRSNSGEGGENPYYFVDGTTATIKQVASGRFGVTAEYLVTGKELEIKVAQGAKPGEGGQLMGHKVDPQIARARHARPGGDLISPPPHHDIYSIEDLKQLIFELKEVNPEASVCVKLVAGSNIGNIAAGVVKAGADVIQISGADGGTGAASVGSMMHAGLPWELGLTETHRTLCALGLRQKVSLRVDGGLARGEDIVVAAVLGAEQFGFGKMLLVAQGCIMARICETNRCPTGIATHDPRFKAKYKGRPEDLVMYLNILADEVRDLLARCGVPSLEQLIGRTDLLRVNSAHDELIKERGIVLSTFLTGGVVSASRRPAQPEGHEVGALNQQVTEDIISAVDKGEPLRARYSIQPTDRAILARVSGALAERTHRLRVQSIAQSVVFRKPQLPPINLLFEGSAGQGFAAFLTGGLSVTLRGEANDSVCKSMSGGQVIIRPATNAQFEPADNVIVGNCALYGATGGRLFVHGVAGDRFGVRNSGATAVVEGAGLHACEYMTGGTVVILGHVWRNIGAGMTGGVLYLMQEYSDRLNTEYVTAHDLTPEDLSNLRSLLEIYFEATASRRCMQVLDLLHEHELSFRKCVPRSR